MNATLIMIIGLIVLYYGTIVAAIVVGLIAEYQKSRNPNRKIKSVTKKPSHYASGFQSASRSGNMPKYGQCMVDSQEFFECARADNTRHMDQARHDADIAMRAHQEAHNMCQHGNDAHNDMFRGSGILF